MYNLNIFHFSLYTFIKLYEGMSKSSWKMELQKLWKSKHIIDLNKIHDEKYTL